MVITQGVSGRMVAILYLSWNLVAQASGQDGGMSAFQWKVDFYLVTNHSDSYLIDLYLVAQSMLVQWISE